MNKHRHDENCHCHDCEDKESEKEWTSIKEAGGVAIGLKGHIHGYNADAAARFAGALLATGKWVEKESGSLLGHIKAAVYGPDGKGMTFNLTNLDNGVEQHGTLPPTARVDFSFMSAVLDVDPHALEHVMEDSLEDSGIDYHLEGHHHHDHHPDHHDHEHCHDHSCHDHGHSHGGKEKVCGCEACEDRRKEEAERAAKGSFWDNLRRRKK